MLICCWLMLAWRPILKSNSNIGLSQPRLTHIWKLWQLRSMQEKKQTFENYENSSQCKKRNVHLDDRIYLAFSNIRKERYDCHSYFWKKISCDQDHEVLMEFLLPLVYTKQKKCGYLGNFFRIIWVSLEAVQSRSKILAFQVTNLLLFTWKDWQTKLTCMIYSCTWTFQNHKVSF